MGKKKRRRRKKSIKKRRNGESSVYSRTVKLLNGLVHKSYEELGMLSQEKRTLTRDYGFLQLPERRLEPGGALASSPREQAVRGDSLNLRQGRFDRI